jgi:L-threonylcarbamoyladenylate synthase
MDAGTRQTRCAVTGASLVTEVVRVDPESPDPAVIARAAGCLRAGGLVAFPTETVYGLGVHALDRAAVRRLFEAKQRPSTDPLIVHVDSVERLSSLASSVPDLARVLGSRFWPGPLTLVLPRSREVPDEVTAGLDTVAVRVPSHPVARALIAAAAVPVAAPSANLFSRPSATQASHVIEDLDGRIDLVLDAGPATIGVESTVLDLSGETPTVLRPGAVSVDMLRETLPRVDVRGAGRDRESAASVSVAMPAPGMLEKHYSPRAALTLYEGNGTTAVTSLAGAVRAALGEGKFVGVIAYDDDLASLPNHGSSSRLLVRTIGSHHSAEMVASRLYGALRELDAAGVDLILVRGFADGRGLGLAVQDRLRRAAAGRIVRC